MPAANENHDHSHDQTMVPEGEPEATADASSAVAGGGAAVPEAAAEVVQVEGTAVPQRAAGGGANVVTSLYRAREDPVSFPVATLPDLVTDDNNMAWVDLSGYSEGELRHLADLLHLHPISVRASLSPWQRPRLDVFRGHYFITATVARIDTAARRVLAGELDLFVGHNYLISAHKLPLPFVDRITARARHNPELVRLDSAFMLYIILDELVAYYEGLIEDLEDEIEAIEERALVDVSDQFLADLLNFKRYVFALGRLADQHQEVFTAFLRPDFPYVSGTDVEPYYQDLYSRLMRLVEQLVAARDAVNGAFDIYVSHVSHRTNAVMKVLTIVSTVLLPTTVILGFFGTNFQDVPLYGIDGLIMMLTSIMIVTGFVLFLFHRRRWI